MLVLNGRFGGQVAASIGVRSVRITAIGSHHVLNLLRRHNFQLGGKRIKVLFLGRVAQFGHVPFVGRFQCLSRGFQRQGIDRVASINLALFGRVQGKDCVDER